MDRSGSPGDGIYRASNAVGCLERRRGQMPSGPGPTGRRSRTGGPGDPATEPTELRTRLDALNFRDRKSPRTCTFSTNLGAFSTTPAALQAQAPVAGPGPVPGLSRTLPLRSGVMKKRGKGRKPLLPPPTHERGSSRREALFPLSLLRGQAKKALSTNHEKRRGQRGLVGPRWSSVSLQEGRTLNRVETLSV